MPQHVLVPVDGSDHGFAGLEYSLASFPDAELTALYVVDPSHDHEATAGGESPSTERAREHGERILEQAADRADEFGHESAFETLLRTGTPHTEILTVAADDDRGIDHVVLGSHGESPITRPFLGHVSEAVVRRGPVSTTVVPESTTAIRERELPGKVLVPVDGSEQADAALEYALAQFPDADYVAFHALSLPFDRPRSDVEGTYLEKVVTAHERRGEEILESARELASEHDATIETVTSDEKPSTAIVEYAETEDVDQIVMGSHGRSIATRLFTGSVAERVSRRSPRTVTLVRGRPGAD
ncbi:universal stress protein [Natronobacterium texcoconense]|uniref:Nucleotide-binding universal stress protein, UspA family n=1 Tax=Natronobacterium texcoconense TaxID=1095778 RepID=A0A1H1C132_NATTX|nr:universal stress protein [Natronobacterium texcoconense]SDQ57878.1 Nucleotide-binding universal stress protein, UspA family [Natronobacterium texcoconense]